jgi:hypothetical protein
MGNALVVKRTQLPQSQTALRAAQYVRMSTDYQQYPIENQAAVIAAYAQLQHLAIVRTYRDEGESGLTLRLVLSCSFCVCQWTEHGDRGTSVPWRKQSDGWESWC